VEARRLGRAAGLMGSQTAVEPLVTALADPEGEVRIRAARALAWCAAAPRSARWSERWPTRTAVGDPVAEILIGVGPKRLASCSRVRYAAGGGPGLNARHPRPDQEPRGGAAFEDTLKDQHPDLRARAAYALG